MTGTGRKQLLGQYPNLGAVDSATESPTVSMKSNPRLETAVRRPHADTPGQSHNASCWPQVKFQSFPERFLDPRPDPGSGAANATLRDGVAKEPTDGVWFWTA